MTGLVASDLIRRYQRSNKPFTALDGVDLEVRPGTRTAVVGESGSGKTTLLRMLLALDRPDAGSVELDSAAVAPGSARSLRWFRRRVQYIPQDPATSLDPRRSVVDLVATPLRLLGLGGDHSALARNALAAVGLDQKFFERRPSELSGGQNQRVAIARAVACEPDYLLADEPVSGLDLDLREQVLTVLDDLSARTSTALLVVTHDLSVVARLCGDISVMCDGRIVETGKSADVLTTPAHPHTRALLDAVPRLHSV
ncbi:ABC transporter ATP-binding protein [Rhodococcus opacus]|uniref:ABC transporter ATP-binding protein n=1 Tax=Rhodococcus opacus TaxID=37919 RepID=UPI002952CF6B|nr:ABC transporter ATP-binding protein [Rhodococcus opacus]MDV7090229.1 ABC transporter ATP-binding protein [Rhodococcus opacus]